MYIENGIVVKLNKTVDISHEFKMRVFAYPFNY